MGLLLSHSSENHEVLSIHFLNLAVDIYCYHLGDIRKVSEHSSEGVYAESFEGGGGVNLKTVEIVESLNFQ
jgi:hypothetical protein